MGRNMAFDFSGRRIVVTGASRGIGRAIALGFAAAGASVSVCARGEVGVSAMAHDLARFPGTHHTACCDLADGEAIIRYIASAAAALGGIDVLVNNASGMAQGDMDESWEAVCSIDLLATVRASRAALPHLERGRAASIINISSISAFRATLRTPAYGAVKAALVHYTASQAMMLARNGIRANGIAPGSIEFSGGAWEQRKTSAPELYNRTLASIPFGRLGAPEEIADVALFLASPAARWVTGQTIAVDGGQLLG